MWTSRPPFTLFPVTSGLRLMIGGSHDDSVDYDDAEPMEWENEQFRLHVNKRQVIITPKNHYASEEEAKADPEFDASGLTEVSGRSAG